MDYPLAENNIICRIFGHQKRTYVDCNGITRVTCCLDGHTVPPFRKLRQQPPWDFLPDDEQPPGAR